VCDIGQQLALTSTTGIDPVSTQIPPRQTSDTTLIQVAIVENLEHNSMLLNESVTPLSMVQHEYSRCTPSNSVMTITTGSLRCSPSRYTVRPSHWTATTTFAIGCLSAASSHTAFKSQEKSSRCRSPCDWLAVYSAAIYRFYAVYWRTLFCHWAGPTQFSSRLKIECPQRTGKQSQQP
jgi:hypothetical protein